MASPLRHHRDGGALLNREYAVEQRTAALTYLVRMTTAALAPRPTVWASATRAPSIWRGPAVPRSCWVSSTTWPSADAPSGSPFDSSPPDGFTGSVPPASVAPD